MNHFITFVVTGISACCVAIGLIQRIHTGYGWSMVIGMACGIFFGHLGLYLNRRYGK